MPATAGVRFLRVSCGYSMREEPHCWQRMTAAAMSGSVDSHSTIKLWARSKSSSSTSTFALACGFDMKATCCKWPSLCTSAFSPAPSKRCLSCLALAGSLNVAIVTIALILQRSAAFVSKYQSMPGRKIGRRKPFVEHQIHEHSGNGNIKPDRHRPSPDPAMSIPAAPKSRHERDDHKRQHQKREQDVRDQHWKINPRRQSRVTGRFFADVHVIRDVADEEQRR
ncbi:MAG: hypothetical protein QOI04_2315 [Verrucomicrobiota bacterium]